MIPYLQLVLQQQSQSNYSQQKPNTIITMWLSYTQLKYYLTSLRTTKSYLFFQLFQLLLSAIIIITAILSDDLFRQPAVLWLQLFLLLTMIFDLFVVRLISEGKLFKYKRNIVDFVIVIVFTVTLIFMWATQNKVKEGGTSEYQVLLETDDIIIICIIVIRYGIQIFQMIKTIKNTRKNIQIQKNIKDVDLNKTPNASVVDYGHHEQANRDQVIRQKIQQRQERIKNNKELQMQMDESEGN